MNNKNQELIMREIIEAIRTRLETEAVEKINNATAIGNALLTSEDTTLKALIAKLKQEKTIQYARYLDELQQYLVPQFHFIVETLMSSESEINAQTIAKAFLQSDDPYIEEAIAEFKKENPMPIEDVSPVEVYEYIMLRYEGDAVTKICESLTEEAKAKVSALTILEELINADGVEINAALESLKNIAFIKTVTSSPHLYDTQLAAIEQLIAGWDTKLAAQLKTYPNNKKQEILARKHAKINPIQAIISRLHVEKYKQGGANTLDIFEGVIALDAPEITEALSIPDNTPGSLFAKNIAAIFAFIKKQAGSELAQYIRSDVSTAALQNAIFHYYLNKQCKPLPVTSAEPVWPSDPTEKVKARIEFELIKCLKKLMNSYFLLAVKTSDPSAAAVQDAFSMNLDIRELRKSFNYALNKKLNSDGSDNKFYDSKVDEKDADGSLEKFFDAQMEAFKASFGPHWFNEIFWPAFRLLKQQLDEQFASTYASMLKNLSAPTFNPASTAEILSNAYRIAFEILMRNYSAESDFIPNFLLDRLVENITVSVHNRYQHEINHRQKASSRDEKDLVSRLIEINLTGEDVELLPLGYFLDDLRLPQCLLDALATRGAGAIGASMFCGEGQTIRVNIERFTKLGERAGSNTLEQAQIAGNLTKLARDAFGPPSQLAPLKHLDPAALKQLAEIYKTGQYEISDSPNKCYIFIALILLSPKATVQDKINAFIDLGNAYGEGKIVGISHPDSIIMALRCFLAAKALEKRHSLADNSQIDNFIFNQVHKILRTRELPRDKSERTKLLEEIKTLLMLIAPKIAVTNESPNAYSFLYADTMDELNYIQGKAKVDNVLPIETYSYFIRGDHSQEHARLVMADQLCRYAAHLLSASQDDGRDSQLASLALDYCQRVLDVLNQQAKSRFTEQQSQALELVRRVERIVAEAKPIANKTFAGDFARARIAIDLPMPPATRPRPQTLAFTGPVVTDAAQQTPVAPGLMRRLDATRTRKHRAETPAKAAEAPDVADAADVIVQISSADTDTGASPKPASRHTLPRGYRDVFAQPAEAIYSGYQQDAYQQLREQTQEQQQSEQQRQSGDGENLSLIHHDTTDDISDKPASPCCSKICSLQ